MKEQLVKWYLESVNDFITVAGFATFHGLTYSEAITVIAIGKQIHERNIGRELP